MKGSTLFIIGILTLFIWIIVGVVTQKDDVIINETDTHITVKQYRMYNADSVINVYKKPIRYEGTVIGKQRRVVGVIGKGGHITHSYNHDKNYITYEHLNYAHLTYINLHYHSITLYYHDNIE